ncbi:hypothetical protein G0Q06_11860 [Puniceicoccales bacterium CK1056]|uniref:Periplasmic copper-binding protein NosD beta helix domain-containing protein n=1 Tax=Oceanipulchritudo coccoides TaxID=2706888 RepID=A0A6B2M661_9BACT|nr:NosD domain-containing protein [Oceanipulchritudo coccoides]NDV63150.1 hypothetical protein [Oceanipulchritudo coccoides]
MKRILLVLLSWSLASVCASAATHAVLPGTSIQAKVDIAAPGDTIAIFGGTYQQTVNIDKALTVVPVSGEIVTIAGLVSVTDGQGVLIQNIDTDGTGISVSGTSSVSIQGGTHQSISQTGGELAVSSAEILGSFTASSAAQKTTAFRIVVGSAVNWAAQKAWLGYSEADRLYFSGTGTRAIIVGCTIDRASYPAISLSGSDNEYSIINNILRIYFNTSDYNKPAILVQSTGTSTVSNNYIQNAYPSARATGIYSPASTSINISNNIFHNFVFGVYEPFGISASNNLYWQVSTQVAGGVIQENPLAGDPLFIDNDPRTLQPDSPCINAGTDNPLYANRDGSRNTIGPTGGAWFDPDGWTTENPVVISFDLGPEVLLEGVDTEVLLSNGQAVSQP